MTLPKSLHVSSTLELPLDAVTSTFALLSVRGAGKSNAGAVMAEEMWHAELPFVAIDPVGSWSGLRAGREGRPEGGIAIPIFGGKNGDVPLQRGAGTEVADLIVDKRLSCVLDLTDFASENDKKAFLLSFAQRLYKKNESPLHLFLEEADDYIPQKPMRDEAQLLRAWENIVRRGRSRGLGMTLITQRSAAINKMVLTQVETLFVLRTTGPQDINAIEAWVKYHQVDEELLGSLASLDDGEAWVWSPHYLKKIERLRFRLRETFDSGQTPKNLRGKDQKKRATLADVDLTDLRTRWKELVDQAELEDPKLLRKRIAVLEQRLQRPGPNPSQEGRVTELETQLAALQAENSQQDYDDAQERIAHEQNLAQMIESIVSDLTAQVKQLREQMLSDITRFEETARALSVSLAMDAKTPPAPAPKTFFLNEQHETHTKKSTSSSHGALPAGERAVLTAVAQTPGGVTREQVSILTGYKTSTRNAYLSRALAAGFLTQSGNLMVVTAKGLNALGPKFERLPTGRALQTYWMQKLPEGERRVLSVMLEAYPKAVSRGTVSSRTGYKTSTRNAYISRLATRKLVTEVGDGLFASEELF